ncbi:MAG: flippase [Alphaproteobacteria bacterium]|nr:MAG: flippase [Alphaproteobacteria bacterium]
MIRRAWSLALSRPALALGGNLLQKLIALVTNIVLAQALGAEGYGAVALGLSFFLMVQAFASLGLTEGMVRYGAVALAHSDRVQFFRIFMSSSTYAVLLNILVALLIALFATPISHFFDAGDDFARLLRLMMAAVPLFTFIMMVSTYWQARQMVAAQQGILVARVALMLVLTLPLHFMAAVPSDFGMATLVAHILVTLAAFVPLVRDMKGHPGFLNRHDTRRMIGFSLAILMSNVSWLIWSNLDRFMLAKMGTLADVGAYNVVAVLALNMQIGVTAMGGLVMPVCAAAHARGDRAGVADAYGWYSLIGVFVAGGAGVALMLEAPGVLGLFGPEFTGFGTALAILVAGQFVTALSGPVGKLLIVVDHQRFTVVGSFVQVLLNVVFNTLLIPIYGVIGAAIATFAALVLPRIVYTFYIRVKLGFWTPDPHALLATLAMAAAALVADQVGTLLPMRILAINITDYLVFGALCTPAAVLIVRHRQRRRLPQPAGGALPQAQVSDSSPE